jgi:hypothetical protein
MNNEQEFMERVAKRALGIDISPPKAPLPTMGDADVCAYLAMTHTPEEIGSWLAALVYGDTKDNWNAADEVRREVNDLRVIAANLEESQS